jgi:ferritin-like metal-binding protein YciE
MASYSNRSVRSVFVIGLQNVHAVENQALALIDRQLDRLVRYPEVADRLRAHRIETEHQIRRLDELLAELGEGHSSLKDAALNFLGNMAALSHVMAADEILKNSFVNVAFENYEIASYTSLITLAEANSFTSAATLLTETLKEEQVMAAWAQDILPSLTLKYIGLASQGERASH